MQNTFYYLQFSCTVDAICVCHLCSNMLASTYGQVNTQTVILKCKMCLYFLCSKNDQFIETQIDEFWLLVFLQIVANRMVNRLSKYTFFQFPVNFDR